jgi:hypothetical protein
MNKYLLIILASLFPQFNTIAQHDISSFDYSIKNERLDGQKIRIKVFTSNNNELIYSIILKDLALGHYHPYEFHQGNLYVIHQSTSSLYKYDNNKKGYLVYTTPGIDFRVSPDENFVAIRTGDSLLLLNSKWNKIRVFDSRVFNVDGFKDICFAEHFLYFTNGGPGAGLNTLFKVNLNKFSWSKKVLPNISVDIDYSFNPFNETVACSDIPFLYDADSYKSWENEKHTVTLYLFDFRTMKKTIVATSTAKAFKPKWIDNSHIQFNNPVSSNRIVWTIKK